MAIPITIPSVSVAATDHLAIITSILALEPTGGSQVSFEVDECTFSPPEVGLLEQQVYDGTNKVHKVGAVSPVSVGAIRFSAVLMGFTETFNSTFLTGLPVVGACRLWGRGRSDATDIVRFVTDQFDCVAHLSGDIQMVKDGIARATVQITVNGAMPTWNLNEDTTP